jgi:DNA-binding MarR family transcriptional regulator
MIRWQSKCYPSLMPRPAHQPLGLHLTRVSRTVSRAFDDALFFRLRDAATAFDHQLRTGLSDTEASQLETILTRLRDNVRS